MELEWVASEKAAAKRARAAQRKAAARRRSGQPQSMGGGQRASERGKQQLHRACAEGDLEAVRLLLLDELTSLTQTNGAGKLSLMQLTRLKLSHYAAPTV